MRLKTLVRWILCVSPSADGTFVFRTVFHSRLTSIEVEDGLALGEETVDFLGVRVFLLLKTLVEALGMAGEGFAMTTDLRCCPDLTGGEMGATSSERLIGAGLYGCDAAVMLDNCGFGCFWGLAVCEFGKSLLPDKADLGVCLEGVETVL